MMDPKDWERSSPQEAWMIFPDWDPHRLEEELNLGPIGRTLVNSLLQERFARRVAEAVNTEFGPGVWDQLVRSIPPNLAGVWLGQLVFVGGSGHVLDELAEGLARRWRLVKDEARRNLKKRANTNSRSRNEEKVGLLKAGILLAAHDIERPQTIRLGKRWVVDEEGRKAILPPLSLRADLVIQWLADRAMKEAEAELLDDPKFSGAEEVNGQESGHELLPLLEATGPEELATALERSRRVSEEISHLLNTVTPRQREVLEALLASIADGADLPEAKAHAAERLSVGVKAIDMTLSRLRSQPNRQ